MDLKSMNPRKHALTVLDEFKAFAFKGNVVDLAVGVIIGGAFGNIVNSLVHNVLMPVIGVIVPSQNGYERWEIVVGGKVIPYGRFIGDIVNFLIVAFALYLFIVKFLGWIMSFRAQQAAGPTLTKDQVLLTEIRDLLKEGNSGQEKGGGL
jgi:large conductance mechanosensitive channel